MIVFIPPWVRDSPKASLDVQQSQIIVNERFSSNMLARIYFTFMYYRHCPLIMIREQMKSILNIVPAGAVRRFGRPLSHIHMRKGYVNCYIHVTRIQLM